MPRTLDFQGFVSSQDPRTFPTRDIRALEAQGGDPNAIVQQGQTQSADVGNQILDLLRKYQQFGKQQEIGGQQEQIQRTFQTPEELIGAAPGIQAQARGAAVGAIRPTIGGARSLVSEATSLLKEYEQRQEKDQNRAQDIIDASISSGPSGLEELMRVSPEIFKAAGTNTKSYEAVLKGLKAQEAEKKRQFDIQHVLGGEKPGDYRKDLNEEIDAVYGGDYGRQGAREKALARLRAKYPGKDVATDIYTRIPDGYEQNIAVKTTAKGGRLQELLQKSNSGQNLDSLSPAELLELNSLL